MCVRDEGRHIPQHPTQPWMPHATFCFQDSRKHDLEMELLKFYQEQAEGAAIRARVKWLEEGEKNSKYFLGLEKSRQANNAIKIIEDSNGVAKNM